MKTVTIFDKPMCCSTGVCGPQIDPALPRFAADLEWLKSQGHRVERYNLAQQPTAFTQNPQVQHLLTTTGTDCLPVIMVDGQVLSQRGYPARELLALWMAGSSSETVPVVGEADNCCGGSSCC